MKSHMLLNDKRFFTMRRALLCMAVLMLLLTRTTLVAGTPADSAIQRDVITMYRALIANDWDTYMKFVYPGLVRAAGSKEKFMSILQKGLADIKAHGFGFKEFSPELSLQTVTAGKDLQTVVPVMLVMNTPSGPGYKRAYMIGISSDKGQTWTFVDASQFDMQIIRTIIPNYNPKLKIPKGGRLIIFPGKKGKREESSSGVMGY